MALPDEVHAVAEAPLANDPLQEFDVAKRRTD
jgi:hypothetical protein